MHEHGEADRLMRQALTLAEEQGLSGITKMEIGVGALTGLSQQALKEQLKHVAEHLGIGDLNFAFKTVLPEAVCQQCGKNIGQEYICPFCGGKNIKITNGLDAVVVAVT
jgi:Zn finger protein HypA/HybF involved in hydrogenase expression